MFEDSNGDEALAWLGSQHADLVIIRIMLPATNGFEFVRRLRGDPSEVIGPCSGWRSSASSAAAAASATVCTPIYGASAQLTPAGAPVGAPSLTESDAILR